MTSIASWGTPQNPAPRTTPPQNMLPGADAAMAGFKAAQGTPAGVQPLGAGMAGGLDPKAIAANPQGFAQWQQDAAAFNAGGQQTGGGTPGNAGIVPTPPWGAPGAQMQSFGPGNDMRFQSIMPQDSMNTQTYNQYTNDAAAGLNSFQFQPFQGMQPLQFGQERAMTQGANAQMQGLNFDFSGANAAYGNAVSAQQGAAGRAGNMLQSLAGQGNTFGGGGAQASTGRFNQELDGALQGLQGPDRGALAAETLKLLEERTQPGFEAAQRQTGQRAAALGRLGSGMTTNDLTGVLQGREQMLDQSRRELATDAAGRTLDDRLQVANMQRGVANDRFGGEQFNAELGDRAAGRAQQGAMFGANLQRGIAGDLYGMGRDAAGMQMDIGDRSGQQARDRTGLGERQAGFARTTANDLGNFTRDEYGAARDERDTRRRDEYDQFGTVRNRLNDFAGLRDGERRNDFNTRSELRGERGYQDMQGRRAIDDEYRRGEFEEGLRTNRGNRAQGTASLGFSGQSPAGFYQNQANQAQGQANQGFGDLTQFMQQMMAGQRPRGGG